MTAELNLSMSNSIADLVRLIQSTEEFLEAHNLPSRVPYLVNLVLEEVLTNVVKYAFDAGSVHEIRVRVVLSEAEVEIECSDPGKEFNPLALRDPELGTSILACEPGGLGVHLVKKMVDSIDYRRENGINVLTARIGLHRA